MDLGEIIWFSSIESESVIRKVKSDLPSPRPTLTSTRFIYTFAHRTWWIWFKSVSFTSNFNTCIQQII